MWASKFILVVNASALKKMWMIRWLLSIIVLFQTKNSVTVQALTSMTKPQQFVGFDLGTSGARISVIEASDDDTTDTSRCYKEVYTKAIPWDETGTYDDPDAWIQAIETLLSGAKQGLGGNLQSVASICVSGTSASCLLMDRSTLQVTRSPRMYNYNVVTSASASAASNDDETTTFGARAPTDSRQALGVANRVALDKGGSAVSSVGFYLHTTLGECVSGQE